jgi:hypothetical protein
LLLQYQPKCNCNFKYKLISSISGYLINLSYTGYIKNLKSKFRVMACVEWLFRAPYILIYRENFYSVDQFHCSTLHSGWGTACCEAHTNFANESACLMADDILNKVVTIHRSQEVLKMLSLYTQLIGLLKTQIQQYFFHLEHTRCQSPLDGAGLRGFHVDSVSFSSYYFVYLCIPACETTRHQKRMSIADRPHLRWQTVETNCKNEPCCLDCMSTKRAYITVVLYGLSFSNHVALLALDFDALVS